MVLYPESAPQTDVILRQQTRPGLGAGDGSAAPRSAGACRNRWHRNFRGPAHHGGHPAPELPRAGTRGSRRGVTRLSPGVVVIGDVRLSTYTSAPVRGSSPWPSVGRMVRALDPRAAAGVLGADPARHRVQPHGRLDEVPTGYEAMNNREALKVLVRPHRPRCRSHWRKHEHHVGTDGRAAAGRRHRPQARRAHRRRPVRGHLGAPELARRDRSRSPSPLSSRTAARSSSSATCASPGRTA